MSEQTENKGGIGVSGVVGGVAGGVGAYKFTDTLMARRTINNVLFSEKEAIKPEITKRLEEAGEKFAQTNPKFVHKLSALEALNDRQGGIKSIKFVADKKGGYAMSIKEAGGQRNLLRGVKALPEGITAGTTVEGESLAKLFQGEKSFVKNVTNAVQKEAITGVRKANGFFAGFKLSGAGGKAAIAAATVAGIAVGSTVLHAIFGGRHSSKVEAEQQAPTTEPAAGRV